MRLPDPKKIRENHDLVVFTNGCFDVFHPGHIMTLNHAHKLAGAGESGVVVVGLNSDDSVRRLKGPSRPIMSVIERARMLLAIRYVDYVIPFEEDTPLDLIGSLRPDFVVKGGDYIGQNVVGEHFSKVSFAPYEDGFSTTDIIERIRKR